MDVQRYNHSKHEHEPRYTTPNFKTKFEIEQDAVMIYTRTIFHDVQDEMETAMLYCNSYNVTEIGDQILVDVKERRDGVNTDETKGFFWIRNFRHTRSGADVTVSCSCNRYESYGLLCRHAFLVLQMFNIKKFPRKYVVRRWTREEVSPKYEDSNNKVEQLSETSPEASAIIRTIFYSVEYSINRLVGDLSQLSMYSDTLKDMMMKIDVDVPIPSKPNKNDMMSYMLGVTEPTEVAIENPDVNRNKGCSKRIKHVKELSMLEKTKMNRICSACGKQKGHNINTCPYKNFTSSS